MIPREINDLSGERAGSVGYLMPRVSVEPLDSARVPEGHGGIVGPDLVRRAFVYDPATGHFTRVEGRKLGLAGAINNLGYRLIGIVGKKYRAHRLAWLYVHGAWPTGEIDHINGIRDDNRIENLRDVSNRVNQQNRRKALKSGSTGLLGVSPTKRGFKAAISLNKASRYLGRFDTAEEAHAAYVDAKRELHEGCTL